MRCKDEGWRMRDAGGREVGSEGGREGGGMREAGQGRK